jgi:hypothetical protein
VSAPASKPASADADADAVMLHPTPLSLPLSTAADIFQTNGGEYMYFV